MTHWDHIIAIAKRMLREPREAAGEIMDLRMPVGTLVPAFVVVMILSVIVTEPLLVLASSMFPGEPLPPLLRAIGSVVGGLAVVWVIWKLGGLFGGQARFEQVLLAFVFLELIFTGGVLGLLILTALLPYLAGFAGIGFVIYWLWMFAVTLDEVQGFRSPWKAFAVVLMSWVIVNYTSLLVLNLLAGLFGGPSNV